LNPHHPVPSQEQAPALHAGTCGSIYAPACAQAYTLTSTCVRLDGGCCSNWSTRGSQRRRRRRTRQWRLGRLRWLGHFKGRPAGLQLVVQAFTLRVHTGSSMNGTPGLFAHRARCSCLHYQGTRADKSTQVHAWCVCMCACVHVRPCDGMCVREHLHAHGQPPR